MGCAIAMPIRHTKSTSKRACQISQEIGRPANGKSAQGLDSVPPSRAARSSRDGPPMHDYYEPEGGNVASASVRSCKPRRQPLCSADPSADTGCMSRPPAPPNPLTPYCTALANETLLETLQRQPPCQQCDATEASSTVQFF